MPLAARRESRCVVGSGAGPSLRPSATVVGFENSRPLFALDANRVDMNWPAMKARLNMLCSRLCMVTGVRAEPHKRLTHAKTRAVVSTNVASVGYVATCSLEIEFVRGAVIAFWMSRKCLSSTLAADSKAVYRRKLARKIPLCANPAAPDAASRPAQRSPRQPRSSLKDFAFSFNFFLTKCGTRLR